MMHGLIRRLDGPALLVLALIVVTAIYWPGLYGGWLFDDYPNIVDNQGVQIKDATLGSLTRAALSSPASEFKRPLASLSFAANYLIAGLDPYWMKLTNLVIHLLNGMLVFLLARSLLLVDASRRRSLPAGAASAAMLLRPRSEKTDPDMAIPAEGIATEVAPADTRASALNRAGILAALIAASWMLLPINLTGVLYVVQRMESMANVFVLVGLLGYVAGRGRMLSWHWATEASSHACVTEREPWSGFALCAASIVVPAAIGILAKETAVMLPLYAVLIEGTLFRFQKVSPAKPPPIGSIVETPSARRPEPAMIQPHAAYDRRIIGLFSAILALPLVIGLVWLLPGVFNAESWATRDFTLGTRLLSEARIVSDYVVWTLFPTPSPLSFYHDNFHLSTGLLRPWTTAASIIFLALLAASAWVLRVRNPLVTLGIGLFLGCHLLTGTVLPLELIYEHRNYFASFGLMLAVVPLLAVPRTRRFGLSRNALFGGLLLCWSGLTAFTTYAWGDPLRLAQDLAERAPDSPRAEYELGRTYIVYSHYDPASPFTHEAYAPLEKSAALPDSSILPEQALIFMNARMHLPLKDAWWNSMIEKLKAHTPTVQDESSLAALTQCMREHHCDLPKDRMTRAFMAALAHPNSSARLLATYSDYAWDVLFDHELGLRMIKAAVKVDPNEPAYRITEIRMLVAQDRPLESKAALEQLDAMNVGGSLSKSLAALRARISGMSKPVGSSSAQ